jgi:hypothetical protein
MIAVKLTATVDHCAAKRIGAYFGGAKRAGRNTCANARTNLWQPTSAQPAQLQHVLQRFKLAPRIASNRYGQHHSDPQSRIE